MSVVSAYMVPHPPMILPEIGRGEEEEIRETIDAYEIVADEIAEIKPETIIISSPHSVMYSDYFHISPGKTASGSFSMFGAPEVRFEQGYDTELVKEIENLAFKNGIPAGTLGERDKALDHGTMIPIYFIRKKYTDFKVIRAGISGLPLTDHYALATYTTFLPSFSAASAITLPSA